MDKARDRVGDGVRVGLFALLVVLATVIAGPGGIVFIGIVHDWAGDPRGFSGIGGALAWLLGVGAAVAVAVGAILAGVALRLLAWRGAPLASLALAVVTAAFVIGTYLVFSEPGDAAESMSRFVLVVVCSGMLVTACLPPFLHWAMAQPTVSPEDGEIRP